MVVWCAPLIHAVRGLLSLQELVYLQLCGMQVQLQCTRLYDWLTRRHMAQVSLAKCNKLAHPTCPVSVI